MSRARTLAILALIATGATACALRFGRAREEELRVVVATLRGPADAAGASFLETLQPDVTLMSTGERDSAYARWQERDTTTVDDPAADGIILRRVRSETPRGRELHLIVARTPDRTATQDAVRALLSVIARDVSHEGVVLLALRTTALSSADSIGALLEPAFAGVARCEDQHDMLAAIQPGALRLYYRPATRVRCDAVRGFDSPFPTLLARVELSG